MKPPRRPTNDPLFLKELLEHRVEIPVLGLPVRFSTNDRQILDHIVEAFGHWRGTDVDSTSLGGGADIRVFLQDGDEGSGEASITYRAPDPMRWIVHTPGSVGIADVERRSGDVWVTRTLVQDRARFRVSILQFVVLIIITIDDRTPFHAALIAKNDVGLVLAGPAGVGKSTLAYEASRAGFQLLSDDAAYVQLQPHRVWGSGPSVLLLDDVAKRFPELARIERTLFPTGKRKVVVSHSSSIRAPNWVSRARVCVLSRSGGAVSVERISADEVVGALTIDPSGASVRFGKRLGDAAHWLAGDGAWSLSLSSDPTEAVPILQELLAGA
jgi:hypothetical protein